MKNGFTLTEILIVIAVIGFFSSLSLSAVKSEGKSLALSRSTYALVGQIRKVQEMAIALRKINNVLPQGYGIYIDKTSQQIILFADTNSNEIYDSNDYKISDFQLEKNVSIQSLEVRSGSSNVSASQVSLIFKPPRPLTLIKIQSPLDNYDLAFITLSANGLVKKIKVNKIGLIAIE